MKTLFTMALVLIVVVLVAATPAFAQSGPTTAPDLLKVDNFRTVGDINGDGFTDTAVDFTFDQPADLQGGPGNFQLVPIDASEFQNQELDGIGEPLAGDGTETITIAFTDKSSQYSPVDSSKIARGYVDTGTVQLASSQDGKVNPLESADVSNQGNTGKPDLVQVVRGNEAGNFLIYEFDEEVTEIGDTSGFNIYLADSTESSNVSTANILTDDPTRVRVTYGSSTNVENAVGASVEANAVVGAGGGDGPEQSQDKNRSDEVLVAAPDCTVVGTPYEDNLSGTSGEDVVCGLEGDDVLKGLSGADTLRGSFGNDTLRGGDGNDNLQGDSGDDRISGDAGDDLLYGQGGDDALRGGEGEDRLSGGAGDDNLGGGQNKDKIFGLEGVDLLYGQGGNDTLRGNEGEDRLSGGSGNDNLGGGRNKDKIFGLGGDDTLYGQGGNDTLRSNTGEDRLLGGSGADNMGGGANRDRIFGQDGNDTLYGQDGDDTLRGGANADRLFGQAGRDYLNSEDGVRGNDLVNGGGSKDTCATDPEDRTSNCP